MRFIKSQNKALNEEVAEEVNPTSTPEVETKASEEVEESKAEVTAEAKEEPTKTEGESKKGYSNRVRELANKANAAEAKAKSLEETIAELTGSVEPYAENKQQIEPQVEPGAEISPEQYKSDIMRSADALVTLRVKQSEAINRINTETSEALRTYPELDPDSDDFNGELSETITEAVSAHVKADPYSASVKKFVGKLMKPYKGAVTKEVGKATEQVAKQASEAALKPTSVRKGEKTAGEKSIAELERELGIVQN